MSRITREWAMPSADTFSVKPIELFVRRWLDGAEVTVDPFARNSRLCKYRNDLNPNTAAEYHMDAVEFLAKLADDGVRADAVVVDPPYSPRQISECYAEAGISCGMADTQNAAMYSRVRDAVVSILAPNAVVLSFGWNSVGMGTAREFRVEELLLVCHGGSHNDTICLAERYVPHPRLF